MSKKTIKDRIDTLQKGIDGTDTEEKKDGTTAQAAEPEEERNDEPISFQEDKIGWLLSYKERRVKQPIKKKTYLKLMILGVFGAHRFYAKQWTSAVIYLLLCWTGLSIANTIIDLLVVIPMQPDENGIIWI